MRILDNLSIVAFLSLTMGTFAYGAYPDPATSGVRDVMLVFDWSGGTPENLLPSVAYLSEAGTSKDWMYDGFMFLRSGKYVNGVTTKADWDEVINTFFSRDIANLKSAMDTAAKTLGPPGSPRKVVLFIPYPSASQTNFGDVDGDGASENLSVPAQRQKVLDWFVRTVKTRFDAQNYQNLQLWGYYWNGEGIYAAEDKESIKYASASAHGLGKKLMWIPYYEAPGITYWQSLGIDVATLQPHFAWASPVGGTGIPDENRLSVAANMCRKYGMGLEMEFYGADVNPTYRANSQLYISHCDATLDGYLDTVHTYYELGIAQSFCRSANPGVRQIYEDMYRFAKGTYTRRAFHQPLPSAPVLGGSTPAQSTACLVDGNWRTQSLSGAQVVNLSGPKTTLTFELAGGRLIGDVRVHFTAAPSGVVVSPNDVTVSLSTAPSGESFVESAAIGPLALSAENGGGFGILNFPAKWARRMRLSFDIPAGQQVAVDECLVLPAAQPLWGMAYAAPGSTGNGTNLTDGLAGNSAKTVWNAASGQVSFNLPEARYAGSLWVHFVRQKAGAFAPQAAVDAASGGAGAAAVVLGDEAWAAVPVNRMVSSITITLADASAGEVAVDELAFLGDHPAFGKSYTLTPAFSATYPDTGNKELTDGQLSSGFGDGRTVGWYSYNPNFASWMMPSAVTVVVDLGAARALDKVEAHLLGGGSGEVNFPSAATASFSSDGLQWTPELFLGAPDASPAGWMRQATAGTTGRFVKLKFWMTASWLMLSEVNVWSGGANVASGKPYSLMPQPSLAWANQVDNSAKLTDGFYAAPGVISDWDPVSSFVEFSNINPVVKLDFGGIQKIQGARGHFISNTWSGRYFPGRVDFYTSLDGAAWTLAGSTSSHPTEPGGFATGTMTASFGARDARYVRYEVVAASANSKICMDEVDVMPVDNQSPPAPPAVAATYTLTVTSGTGSGGYGQGASVKITASTPATGKVFDKWTGDTADVAAVNASSTTVTMPAANIAVIATYKDQPLNNQPPLVSAGADKAVSLPNDTLLSGTASDDGQPNGLLTLSWSTVSGPGTVIFSSPASAQTRASFSAAGNYVLRFSASDGSLSAADDVGVIVNPVANQAPVIKAGADFMLTLPQTAALNGAATDDGLPSGTLALAWTKVSGPGTVSFANAAAAQTTAAFSAAGSYVLRFTASDGALSAADDLSVTVNPVTNSAPVVSAGADLAVTLPQTAALSGVATDDGLPSATLTMTWTKVSGPGTVSFANPTAAQTSAAFSAAGSYVLRFAASDGILSAADDLSVTVDPDPDGDHDGLPDIWEVAHGLSPLSAADAALDADGDGLNNLAEYQKGTDINKADTDGDGLPDGWEVARGLDPNVASDATQDPDGDSLTNVREYALHSDPNNRDSDSDGLPDGFEAEHGLNPTLSNATTDTDNDGVSDVQEYLLGHDPAAAEPPVLLDANATGVAHENGTLQLNALAGQAGGKKITAIEWAIQSQPGTGGSITPGTQLGEATLHLGGKGEYVLEATVTDENGMKTRTLLRVQAYDPANLPPVADAGPDMHGETGKPVRLYGLNSSDPEDGANLGYHWSLLQQPSDSSAALAAADTAVVGFTPDKPGLYVFGLGVRDTSGQGSLPVEASRPGPQGRTGDATVYVMASGNGGNWPRAEVLKADITSAAGIAVTLDASASSDLDDDARLSFVWEFVSRPEGSLAAIPELGSANMSFTPDVVGTYDLQVTVNDAQGHSAKRTVTVVAEGAGAHRPKAVAGTTQFLTAGSGNLSVHLDARNSADADADIVSYLWSQLEGPAVELDNALSATPSFVLPASRPRRAGVYRFGLKVRDAKGLSSTDSVVVVVNTAGEHVPRLGTFRFPPLAGGAEKRVVMNRESRIRVAVDAAGDTGEKLRVFWTQVAGPAMAFHTDSQDAQDTVEDEVLVIQAKKAGSYTFAVVVDDGKPRGLEQELTFEADASAVPLEENSVPSSTVDEAVTSAAATPSSSTSGSQSLAGRTAAPAGGGGCFLVGKTEVKL